MAGFFVPGGGVARGSGGKGRGSRRDRRSQMSGKKSLGSSCSNSAMWSNSWRLSTTSIQQDFFYSAFSAAVSHHGTNKTFGEDRDTTGNDITDAGVRAAAAQSVEAVWQAAELGRFAVREAGGAEQAVDNDSYLQLLQRAALAEQNLKSACAEMRVCRAEMMIRIGMEGRALRSRPCWESCGPINQNKGKGKGPGKSCFDCGFPGQTYFDKGWGNWYCAQCWYDGYLEWPDLSMFLLPRIVLGRYEVRPDELLGQGGFSTVRRGRDLRTGQIAAVKTYSEMETLNPNDANYAEDYDFYLQKFRHEVHTFQSLHAEQDVMAQLKELKRMGSGKRSSWYVPDDLDSPDSPDVFSSLPAPNMLFVQLEAFSTDEAGRPGPSPGTGECCVVLELAEFTLDEFLKRRDEKRELMMVEEVKEIFKQLADVLAMLHAKQFVHCDLKPLNIMHFPSGRWKLIDMDGMVTTGGVASLCDVFYTPLYCSPEFAALTLGEDDLFQVSRCFDVWSLGAIAIELVNLRPWLQDVYNEFSEVGPDEYMKWLADPASSISVPNDIWEFEVHLADLCSQMLDQNVELRASMVEVLLHSFLTESDMGANSISISEKRMNHYLQKMMVHSDLTDELTRRAGSKERRGSGGGTCVKRRVSVQVASTAQLAAKPAEDIRLNSSSSSSALSNITEDADLECDFLVARGEEHEGVLDLTTQTIEPMKPNDAPADHLRFSPPARTQGDVPTTSPISKLDVSLEAPVLPSRSSPGMSSPFDWAGVRNQAQATQEKAAELRRKLRVQESIANSIETLFWAAADAEASLWRQAGCLSRATVDADVVEEPCAELEDQVARTGRELQAAHAELWEARDLESMILECEGLAAIL